MLLCVKVWDHQKKSEASEEFVFRIQSEKRALYSFTKKKTKKKHNFILSTRLCVVKLWPWRCIGCVWIEHAFKAIEEFAANIFHLVAQLVCAIDNLFHVLFAEGFLNSVLDRVENVWSRRFSVVIGKGELLVGMRASVIANLFLNQHKFSTHMSQ